MSNYTAFAEFYDQLTDNVDYKKRAEYFCKLLERHGHTMGTHFGFGLRNRQPDNRNWQNEASMCKALMPLRLC